MSFSSAYLPPFLSLCPNYPSRFLRRCSIFVSVLFLVFFLFCFSSFFGFNSAGIQWNLQSQPKELQIDFTQLFFRRFHMQRICFYDFAAFPFRLHSPLSPSASAFSKAIKLQCACHQKCTRYAPPTVPRPAPAVSGRPTSSFGALSSSSSSSFSCRVLRAISIVVVGSRATCLLALLF